MKTLKFSLFAAAVFFITNANAQDAPAVQKPMGITFTEDTYTFGDIEKDKPASHDFTFKNTSNETILITGVKPSCGCTATNYTKTPIKPGETGSVTATYNAHNPGPFTKTLTVSTNDTDATKTLYIKGKVLSPEPTAAAAPVAVAAPVKTAKPAPVAAAKTHTVVEGESLSILAGKYYGDIYKYDVIYQANKDIIVDAKRIEPGQVLKIPAVTAKKATK